MNDVTVSVHQPNFMPWLKLLDKVVASDVYVAYDTAQYSKSEFHARQRIMTQNGPTWLSVPVLRRKDERQSINEMIIDNKQPFRRNHLRMIRLAYATQPYFDEVYPIVEEVYGRDQTMLVDLSLGLIEELCAYLGAQVRIVRSREVPHDGNRTEKVIDLVRGVGGTTHLSSGFGGEATIDLDAFERAGIGIRMQRFDHPAYPQPGPSEFVPDLAAIDMLFACGPAAGGILAGRRRFEELSRAGELRPGW